MVSSLVGERSRTRLTWSFFPFLVANDQSFGSSGNGPGSVHSNHHNAHTSSSSFNNYSCSLSPNSQSSSNNSDVQISSPPGVGGGGGSLLNGGRRNSHGVATSLVPSGTSPPILHGVHSLLNSVAGGGGPHPHGIASALSAAAVLQSQILPALTSPTSGKPSGLPFKLRHKANSASSPSSGGGGNGGGEGKMRAGSLGSINLDRIVLGQHNDSPPSPMHINVGRDNGADSDCEGSDISVTPVPMMHQPSSADCENTQEMEHTSGDGDRNSVTASLAASLSLTSQLLTNGSLFTDLGHHQSQLAAVSRAEMVSCSLDSVLKSSENFASRQELVRLANEVATLKNVLAYNAAAAAAHAHHAKQLDQQQNAQEQMMHQQMLRRSSLQQQLALFHHHHQQQQHSQQNPNNSQHQQPGSRHSSPVVSPALSVGSGGGGCNRLSPDNSHCDRQQATTNNHNHSAPSSPASSPPLVVSSSKSTSSCSSSLPISTSSVAVVTSNLSSSVHHHHQRHHHLHHFTAEDLAVSDPPSASAAAGGGGGRHEQGGNPGIQVDERSASIGLGGNKPVPVPSPPTASSSLLKSVIQFQNMNDIIV